MVNTIPKLLAQSVQKYPHLPALKQKDKHQIFQATSFPQLLSDVQRFAAGLLELDVARGDRVGMISENRQEWITADIGILCIGACDVPRGLDSPPNEIAYILDFSECKITCIEHEEELKALEEELKKLSRLKSIIILDPDYKGPDKFGKAKIYTYNQVMEMGRKNLEKDPDLINREIEIGTDQDIATIIFTSGTTGKPKGVMLSHAAMLNQNNEVDEFIKLKPGDNFLSILPVWHSFERSLQYIILGHGCCLCYSKPVGHIMIQDMEKIRPQWMAGVPRVWEALASGVKKKIKAAGGIKKILFFFFLGIGKIHSYFSNLLWGRFPEFKKRIRFLDILIAFFPWLFFYPGKMLGQILVFSKIKQRLGGKFKAGISGGGALQPDIDSFYSAAGILLLEGWGLTETAPILGVRHQNHPVMGTVGKPMPGMDIMIVDEHGTPLPPGQQGKIMVRGIQIMKGYYNNPEATKEVLSKDGWLDTGDLGMMTHHKDVKIVGRAKDTIVLLGGENIEPLPIEQALQGSPLIETAVVLGQDKKFLAALIVPDKTNLEEKIKDEGLSEMLPENFEEDKNIRRFYEQELSSLITRKNGFRDFERIYRFKLMKNSFQVGEELSAKREVKRHVIDKKFKEEIEGLFQ